MPRILLSLAAWQAVARELPGAHAAAPPGVERIRALVAQAPPGWPEQLFALEVDAISADAVRTMHAAQTNVDRDARQRATSVSEAMRIIHDHQQRG
ncbi:MAG: hypothetical protein K0S78_1930 [Thermomicrobiales bacterium]|jgi:hypothetical protein|nr:hypothetical protein [Thermomicrobiales bacterium]